MKISELCEKVNKISCAEFSKKDKERMILVIQRFMDEKDFNGIAVADELNISDQLARRLLRKAEKKQLLP